MQTMMRQQMVETLEDMLPQEKNMVIVLADISDELFHQQRQEVRERLFNLGIMEQTMISVAAGFALEGFIPVVHSFAPFLAAALAFTSSGRLCERGLSRLLENIINAGDFHNLDVVALLLPFAYSPGQGNIQI